LNKERKYIADTMSLIVGKPISGYIWAFRWIHPLYLIFTSFVISQVFNEVILYEIMDVYEPKGTTKTTIEVVLPLTLWLFIDTMIQVILSVAGLGQRLLVQVDDEILVYHRKLFTRSPDKFVRKFKGWLNAEPHLYGMFIDKLDTDIGRFFVWGGWRDMRLLISQKRTRYKSE
jgi:hypothetical protein